MESLSDNLLQQTYDLALKLQLNDHFIHLIEQEMQRRKLRLKIY